MLTSIWQIQAMSVTWSDNLDVNAHVDFAEVNSSGEKTKRSASTRENSSRTSSRLCHMQLGQSQAGSPLYILAG